MEAPLLASIFMSIFNPFLTVVTSVQVADLYQEAEPLVAVGVAATLQLAAKKGFVTDSSSKPPKRPDNVIVQTSAGKRDM